jgi:hypothetical protein
MGLLDDPGKMSGLQQLFDMILGFITALTESCAGGPFGVARQVRRRQRGLLGRLRVRRAYNHYVRANAENDYPLSRRELKRSFIKTWRNARRKSHDDLMSISADAANETIAITDEGSSPAAEFALGIAADHYHVSHSEALQALEVDYDDYAGADDDPEVLTTE